jgi:hypothetical protein
MTLGLSLTLTITGAQVAVIGGTIALSRLMFASTRKSNGFKAYKYPGDHYPDHIHLKGTDGSEIRIDRSGNPLKRDGKMNPQQGRALKDLWEEILKLFEEAFN